MATDESKANDLELWNTKLCPFGQRAWWAILMKNVPPEKFSVHWENLGNKSDEFKLAYKQALFANPENEGATPTIKHNGHYITESDMCAKYINRAFDGLSLLPSDAFNELLMESKIKEHHGPLFSSMMAIVKGKDVKGEKLLSALKQFNESLLRVSKEGFLFEKEFTFFELFIFPIFYRFEAAEKVSGVALLSKWLNKESNCDESKSLQRVINWFNTVNALPSVNEMRKISTLELITKRFQTLHNQ